VSALVPETTAGGEPGQAGANGTGGVDGTARTDAVLNGRNAAAAVRIAGLIAAGELDTVGTPRKLPMDEFPDDDPEVVRRVWERALVVGVRAGQLMAAPRFYRDKLDRLQGELAAAGFEAMGRAVGRAREAVPGHPADSEDGYGH
jgi:hypothetical protein